jgi:sulfoxide reductase heme-binding subunit YedZ
MPWRDPAGRFSPFKLAVFLLLFVPAMIVGYRYLFGLLGARPTNQAIHEIGNWSLRLILLSMAVTPARRILRWVKVLQVRRMIGVAAFAYVAVHFVLYVASESFDLGKVASEIALRIYLTIGFIALLILMAMAITSTDGMLRRMGGKNWRRLHRFVYLAGILAVVHFFMQTKANVNEPWVMAGLFAWLMCWRALNWIGWYEGRLAEWWPLLLALVATAITAIGETIYYGIKLGVDPMRVLEANLVLAQAPRPAVVVLGICLGVAAIAAARQLAMKMAWPQWLAPLGAAPSKRR